MRTEQKVKALQKILAQAKTLEGRDSGDLDFLAWQESTLSTLEKVFGDESRQYHTFKTRIFNYFHIGPDTHYIVQERIKAYNRDLQLTITSLEGYIEDLAEESEQPSTTMSQPVEANTAKSSITKKVFISHASANKDVVGELIEMLKQIGLRQGQIFCTSFPEYSIPLGVNYLDWLKKELSENSLVLFVLSHEFYKSPVCLSEMGATWALSKEHVPIFVPPFTYDESKGPFPLSQGMIITEKFKYNELANMVERLFELPARAGDWERSRDTIITRIEGHVHAGIEARKAKEQADAEERARPFKELSEMMEKSREELAALNKKRQSGGSSRFEAI